MIKITLDLTKEQVSILTMALIYAHTVVEDIHNYNYDDDFFYDDLLKKVFGSIEDEDIKTYYYEPWIKEN